MEEASGMSERITEAGLAEIERALDLQGHDAFEREGPLVSGKLARHLVDELRRLREIVRRVGGCRYLPHSPPIDGFCMFCDANRLSEEPHRGCCVWPYVEAEAEAIRREREGAVAPENET